LNKKELLSRRITTCYELISVFCASALTYTIAKGNKDDTWMHAWFRINTPFNTLAVDHNSNYARALRRIIVLDLNH